MLAKHVQINVDATPHKQEGPYYMLQELVHIISVLGAMILWNTELRPKSKMPMELRRRIIIKSTKQITIAISAKIC